MELHPDIPSLELNKPGFARDSLIHALGSLSAAVLDRAFADPVVVRLYGNWIARARSEAALKDQGERLVTTGTAQGNVTLIARGLRNEFCLACEHARFEAVVALGFDVSRTELIGLCIARFRGDVDSTIRFARALEHEVRSTPKLGVGTTPDPQAN